jgi:3-hydroxybutyryl-CoA dehydrogenase
VPEVGTIAVIGAGPGGREIARAAALAGYRTLLEDILPASLRRAEDEIRRRLDQAVELGRATRSDANATLARIEYVRSIEEAARAADLVIEAVPDELESKLEIFLLLDKMCRPATILASNTASLSVSEIAATTWRPAKCLGMRFGSPAQPGVRLEIVRAEQTDDQTLAAASEVGRRMGREVIVVADRPSQTAPTPQA